MSTTIEWTDETWNPVTGCTKVSQGCAHCYAERVFPRAYGKDRKFTDVRCHPERLDQPLRWKKPRRVFVNSMSDLFHDAVPDDFIKLVLRVCVGAPQHTFQILTKRPQRMLSFMRNTAHCDFFGDSWARRSMSILRPLLHKIPAQGIITNALGNVWLGVSVEDQKTADERIPILLQAPAAVRFVSYEPALGPVDFTAIRVSCADRLKVQPAPNCNEIVHALRGLITHGVNSLRHPKLDWIIAGGESGPNARPAHPDWFRQARDQCIAAGVPFFFKQWGEFSPQSGVLPGEQYPDSSELASRSGVPAVSGIHTDDVWMHRVGKRAAGRLLDGQEWSQFPRKAD